jgi:hypothetical protein
MCRRLCDSHRPIQPIPGPHFSVHGGLIAPGPSLAPEQVVATLILSPDAQTSPYRYILADITEDNEARLRKAAKGVVLVFDRITGYLDASTMLALVAAGGRDLMSTLATPVGDLNMGREAIGRDLDDPAMIKHTESEHGADLMLPPALPSIVAALAKAGVTDGELVRQVVHILGAATWHGYPMLKTTAYVPMSWGPVSQIPPLYMNYLVRRSYHASLEMSQARILNALDMFCLATRYDGMVAFVANTAILSKNEAFGSVSPTRPIRPHQFQRDFLNRLVAKMIGEITLRSREAEPAKDWQVKHVAHEDPAILVDLGRLSADLKLPPSAVAENCTPGTVEYVKTLCGAFSNSVAVNMLHYLFRYACARSEVHATASVSRNQLNLGKIGALVLRRTRRLAAYAQKLEDLTPDDQEVHRRMMADHYDLVRGALEGFNAEPDDENGSVSTMASPSLVVSPSNPGFSPGFTPTATPAFAPTLAALEPDGFVALPDSLDQGWREGLPPIIPRGDAGQALSNALASDIGALRKLLTGATVASDKVGIRENRGPIQLCLELGVAGSGKTSLIPMAAAVVHLMKQMYAHSLPEYNFEIVSVCDQPLVRAETYRRTAALSGLVNVTLIATDPQGRVEFKSNFTEMDSRGNRIEPGFKSPKGSYHRDLIIMGSEQMVAYVMGERGAGSLGTAAGKDGLWCGNPHGYVIIDECGAKLGDLAGIRALADAKGDRAKIAKVFETYAPALLVLTNCPSMISLLGASLVPEFMLRNTIRDHQGGRSMLPTARGVQGKIYVGSQIVLASGEEICLRNLCPPNLFGHLFRGIQDPLVKRLFGHRSAVGLRRQIRAMIAAGGPMADRLQEMAEYLNYDLGIYTGDSVANYAVGLLYFIYLYATRYIGPAPDLQMCVGDMLTQIDAIPGEEEPPVPMPLAAPWPRSHFGRQVEMYLVDVLPTSPGFYAGIGITGDWVRGVPYGSLLAGRARPLAEILGHRVGVTGLPGPILQEMQQELAEAIAATPERTEEAQIWAGFVPRDVVAGETHVWTTFGAAVNQLRTAGANRDDRTVRLLLDPDPRDAAMRLVAALMGKTKDELHEYSANKMRQQRRRLTDIEEKTRQTFEHVDRQTTRGTTTTVTDEGRDGRSSTRKTVLRMGGAEAQHLLEAAAEAGEGVINSLTGNRYIGDAPLSSDADHFLLSHGIVTLCNAYSEHANSQVYTYLLNDRERTTRITMVIMDTAGCYGLNPKRATMALVSPRASLMTSTQTLLQYFCRVGRHGVSDEATIVADTLTLVRILEASIHVTDAALFPNIAIAVDNMQNQPGGLQAWTTPVDAEASQAWAAANEVFQKALEAARSQLRPDHAVHLDEATYRAVLRAAKQSEKIPPLDALLRRRADAPDAVIRRSLVADLTTRLTGLGQTNGECTILPFIVGAVQLHLHEPLGIADYPNVGVPGGIPRAFWPRVSGRSDAGLVAEAVGVVALRFSQARDRSAYNLYDQFMATRTEDSQTLAKLLISHIAPSVMARISERSLGTGAGRHRLDEN